jgi:DNA-binding CsgD family transcriptional regulator/type II secretory pathway predicted ATPase ExeA/tetratricopeptide (TPR) repeat protein
VARTLVSPDLVGRETQVSQLLGALSRAKAGLPGIVLVRGEAGSGKSRLLREFLSQARDDRATTLYGACIDVSAGDIPLVPFRTALRHLVQSRSTSEMQSLLGGTWQDLHVLLPELAPSDAHGAPPAPHVFEVVSAVIARLAGEQPVVIAVDDAQWADQSTLQLLRYLTQSGQPLPLLVLVAYRGEELPGEPGRRKAFEELSRAADGDVTVTPLTGEQVTDLVRRLGIELSSVSMRRLLARSAGLPFLVEELASAEQDGVTQGIPSRIRDVVRLRLGALSQEAQLVVALVAVAARPLRHRVLTEAAHLPARVFAEALDEALSAHLLVADTDERTYGFRHDVSREIVHEDLLAASRLELHVRLAVALQSDLPTDAYAGRLCEVAHHWVQTEAHEEGALRASLLAARASTRAFAHPEAARQYDQVVRLWSRVDDAEGICGTDLVTISAEAAEAGHWAGDTEAALRHIDRALAETRADTVLAAALHERRTHYSWLHSGQLARNPQLLELITSAATRERMRASDLMQAGRYAESVIAARAALELAVEAGATGDEIRATIILGVGLSFAGDPESGVMTIESARARAFREGSSEEVVAAHVNLAFVLLGEGQMERAAQVALAGLDEAIRRGVGGSDGAILAGNAAEALTRTGQLDRAAKVIRDGLDHHPPPALASFLELTGAELDVLRGRLPEAAAALEAIAARGLLDDFQFQQQVRAVEAELQFWDPRPRATALLGDLRTSLGSSVASGDGEEDVPLTARLIWLGLRADADGRSTAEIRDDEARLLELVNDGKALRDRAVALSTGHLSDGVRRQLNWFLTLIEGEISRLSASPDPECWARAVQATDDPYLKAYSLWRQGSALRDVRQRGQAASTLREAYHVASTVGLHAVAAAVVAAGHSLGITVDDGAAKPSPRRVSRPFNLTVKELEVLDLLMQGKTNRRIASALRMTEKTASVHVSHILAKLSVTSRGEAVARAYELGLAGSTVSTGD